MQIFFCTFVIKLQYVKSIKELSQKKFPPSTFQAALKGSKNQLIAIGMCKPTLMNDTAWFNERFQIKSDLLLNPETKQYNASNINLQIKCTSQNSQTFHLKSFSLAQVAQKRMIPQKQYQLSGGLVACMQICCTDIERKGFKQLRKPNINSPTKINNQNFLLLEKVAFEQQKNRDTPQFTKRDSHQIQIILQNNPLEVDDLRPQLKAMREQFEKQMEQHVFTKQKWRSIKDLLEKQYNVNRQLNYTIESLNKKIQQQQKKVQSLQNHLLQTQNLCTALSASLSSKQTEIVQMQQLIDELGEKMMNLSKKNQIIHHLERTKAQLQFQTNGMKKQMENLKLQLNRQYLDEKQMEKQIDKLKNQNLKLTKTNQQMEKDFCQILNKQLQNKTIISKLTEERDTIKRQTTRWRTQFCAQSQRKDQQINQLQEHCRQIYLRYSQISKKQDSNNKIVEKQLVEELKKDYDKKIEQFEQKQAKLRHYIQVIDQQTFNLQEILQQKEQNQQILLQTIKKLQAQIEQYAATNNWWQSILQKQKSRSQSGNDLLKKNKQLIQILHKNSFTILQGEKIKMQLSSLKKQYEQYIQKASVMEQQYKQMKQKVANLYKENKKLQQKNYILNKQKQSAIKKNLWLEDQIKQSKIAEKQARKDYQIITFQLTQMEKKRKKEEKELQNSVNCLSVIRQKSEEHLASSHKFVRQSSIKESIKPEEGPLEREIFGQLAKILQQRPKDTQQFQIHLQKINNKQKQHNLQEQMKNITISSAKTKLALLKSGNKQLIQQWQKAVGNLLGEIQQFVNIS